ncbi:MAG: hypothetical protein CMB77_04120 [Euryarchaeota archaeon]|nr:hypothetical protein [Euryarchaeota archaeon]|tara:strand:+ start:590 stop:826 length:237 start_codon:yes stop_codon:yes gene_type:complete
MNTKLIREFIRLFLERSSDVLGEPDLSNQEEREKEKKDSEKDEMSVAAGMPGVSTPLGTGPTYPAKIVKKNKKRQKKK